MAGRAELRGASGLRAAPGDAAVSLRRDLVAAFSLGSPVPLHALRRPAAVPSDDVDRRPLLWRGAGRKCRRRLHAVESVIVPAQDLPDNNYMYNGND